MFLTTTKTTCLITRILGGPGNLALTHHLENGVLICVMTRKNGVDLDCRLDSSCNSPHTVQRKEIVTYGFN